MKRKYLYLVIAILGLCYTWYYNILFFLKHGNADIFYFFEIAQSSLAGKSFGADLTVVVLTFFAWYIPDARKLKVKLWWILIPFTFLIAIAFAFPMYLFMRENRLERIKKDAK
tara:strand:+ start:667 stop:1005 length:339 start_codon:yes stop_codon:yes gene_type:complete